MKKLLSVLLTIIMLMLSIPFTATASPDYTVYTSGDYKYQISDGAAVIVQYIGSSDSITIPSTLDGYSVSTVEFLGVNTTLKRITIPGSVKALGDDLFNDYRLLESATLSKGLESIGESAFLNCTSLKSIAIPDGVTSIGDGTFYGCTALESAVIGKGIEWMPGDMFRNCYALKSVKLPDTITSIHGFMNCISLTSITIPDKVERIGSGTFWGCTSLTEVNIPDGVTMIYPQAFLDCRSLMSIVVPKSVYYIGNYAFGFSYHPEDGAPYHNIPGFILYGYEGTEAERYAEDSCVNFRSICEHNDWGPATYTWSSDYKTVTAKRVCRVISYHTEEETVNTTSKVTREPTADRDGEITYTAKFTNPAFTTQTKTVAIPKFIEFSDVKPSDWYNEAVQYCAEKGFITGYSNGKFGPADALQRQDFVVILARIAGANLSSYSSCKLSDVNMSAYYGKAVAWAVANGIITGYKNGKFGVGDKITREQVATILYRYMGSPAITGAESILANFPDKGSVSEFAKDALAWANKNGIINGKSDGKLAPTATASRAEIATIVMRMDKAQMFNA